MTKKWLEARRSYLNKLRSQVKLITGGENEIILEYSKKNKELYRKIWDMSSEEEFFLELNDAEVVLCGDFHSSPAVKKFYSKLLKRYFEKSERKIFIGLECFEAKYQKEFDLWLRGRLSEEVLLKRSGWKENWGFSWTMYKGFILELKDLGVEFCCINSSLENFQQRDRAIAKNLSDLMEPLSDIEPIVFCLIGQHHLGPGNLEDKLTERKLSSLCLHLDPDEMYFEVGEYGVLQDANVFKFKKHYCFFNTPPWVHWQSHLLFLDEFLDDEDEYELEEFKDYSEVVFDYISLICKDLELSTDEIKPFTVSHIDEYELVEKPESKIYEIMEPMLTSETSFYWPEKQEGIMVVGSLNHAASIAGRYLHAHLMGLKKLPWGDPDKFSTWCWLEAVGHLLSKFINPKRMPLNVHNLSAFLRARLGVGASKKLMEALVTERVQELREDGIENHPELKWEELIYASRLKGALIGESLFELYSKGELAGETLKTYMSVSVTDAERFEPFYKLILARLDTRFSKF